MSASAIAGRLMLAVMIAAGLWPHFATSASWLAAAVCAGVVCCLQGGRKTQSAETVEQKEGHEDTKTQRNTTNKERIRIVIAVCAGIVLWLLRANQSLAVYPEQLLPRVDQQSFSIFYFILAIGVSIIVVILCRRFPAKWGVGMLLALTILVHAISSFQTGETIRWLSRQEPADYSYNFDGIRYLKSYYLMKDGRDWYRACVESTRVDARAPFDVPRVIMNYRLPTLYVLFSFLPRGDWIQMLFIIFSCFGMVCAFDFVRILLENNGVEFETAARCALAAPVVLSPYLFLAAITWFYTFHEYWAWFVSIGAVWLLARRQILVAIILAVLAACIREHFILVTVVVSILGWISGRHKERLAILGSWVLLFLVYAVHVYRALPYTGQGVEEGASIWLHSPSILSVLYTTFFGTALYPMPKLTIPVLFAFALYGLWKNRNQLLPFGVSSMILIPLLGYLFVGPQIPSGGYWGVLYMPWVFIAGCLVPGQSYHSAGCSESSGSDF